MDSAVLPDSAVLIGLVACIVAFLWKLRPRPFIPGITLLDTTPSSPISGVSLTYGYAISSAQ